MQVRPTPTTGMTKVSLKDRLAVVTPTANGPFSCRHLHPDIEKYDASTAHTYQRNDKSILEGQTGGHGEDGVQTAEHGTKQDHLPRVRFDGHASQVNAQRQQVLITVQGILGRRKRNMHFDK